MLTLSQLLTAAGLAKKGQTMDLAAAVQALLEAGKDTEALRAPIVQELDDRRVILVTGRDPDNYQILTRDPKPRDHAVRTVPDLVRAVPAFGGSEPVVFVSESAAVLVCDKSGDRLDRVCLALDHHTQFDYLGELAENARRFIDQKRLVEILVHDLHGCDIDAAVVDELRQVKVTSSGSAEIVQRKEREKGNREFERESAGAAKLPDSIGLRVQVFEQHDDRQRIECALQFDLEEMRFKFYPLAGELDRAERDAVAAIKASITQGLGDKSPCEVFTGVA